MGKVFKFGGIPRRLNFEPSKECMKLMRSGYGPEPFGKEGQERMATQYALWLARKQGLELEELGRSWVNYGSAGGKSRPRSVGFQHGQMVRGRYGSEWRVTGEPIVIEIPNWNWEPECVEVGAAEPMRMAA